MARPLARCRRSGWARPRIAHGGGDAAFRLDGRCAGMGVGVCRSGRTTVAGVDRASARGCGTLATLGVRAGLRPRDVGPRRTAPRARDAGRRAPRHGPAASLRVGACRRAGDARRSRRAGGMDARRGRGRRSSAGAASRERCPGGAHRDRPCQQGFAVRACAAAVHLGCAGIDERQQQGPDPAAHRG